MKKTLLTALIALISLSAIAQTSYEVSGQIKGLPGDYIILERRGNFPGIDSVPNKDGFFKFQGNIDGATNAFIVAKTEKGPVYKFLIIEPGSIEIQGSFDDMQNAKVTGSKSTAEYDMLRAEHNKNRAAKNELYISLRGEKDSIKIKTIQAELSKIDSSDIAYSKSFISNNPTSPVNVHELVGISTKISFTELQALFQKLDPKVKTSIQAQQIATYISNLEKVQVGQIAPNFSQPDSTGKIVNLTDFRGEYVLVDFWASWCIPCRQEHPNLLNNYKQFKDQGFEILGVSIDSKNDEWRWRRAILNDRVIWPQVSDLKGKKNVPAELYAIQIIPSNFLIDPQGKIIASNLTGENLTNKLSEIFNK